MKVYYSRLDWWIAALLAGSICSCFGMGVYLLGTERLAAIISFGIGVFSILIILLLVVPCKYTMFDDHLLVQSGLIQYTIPYSDILKIAKSNNPLSSPALSLRRVKISKKKGFLLVISPDWVEECPVSIIRTVVCTLSRKLA